MQKSLSNRLYVALLFGMITICLSCGKEDPCSGNGWAGTYNGTINCNGTSEGVTVIIEATASDSIRINYFSPSSATNFFDPFPIAECGIEYSAKNGGGTISLTASLDGNNLSLSEQVNLGGNISSCQIAATRFN